MYRRSSTYDGPTYDFSTLRWCDSDTHSVETVLRILNFDFFPGKRCVVRCSLMTHICRTSTLAHNLSLGSSMVRASHLCMFITRQR